CWPDGSQSTSFCCWRRHLSWRLGTAESRSPVMRWVFGVLLALGSAACGEAPPQPVAAANDQPADAKVKSLADAYLAGFFDRNPDQATYYGVPGRPHDKLPDNSLTAQQTWEAREHACLKDACAGNAAEIHTDPRQAP